MMNTANLSIEQTKRLNEIASELKKDYVDFINQCCSDKQGDIYWWMTPFATRNNAWDDTFKKICVFHLCKKELENGASHKIITDSKGIKKALEKLFPQNQYKIFYKQTGKHIYDKVFQIIVSCKDIILKQKYVKKYLKSFICKKKLDNVFVSHILSSSMNNNDFRDRYFGDIDDYTDTPLFYIQHLVKCDNRTWKDFIKNISALHNEKYIFYETYCKWYDIFLFVVYIFKCLSWAHKKYYFNNIDVSPIIKESLLDCFKMIRVFCDYKAFDRLTKSIEINKLVLWYEARPLDNVMAMTYRKNNPKGKCIGYVGTPMSENFFGQRIIKEQQRQKACPDLIAVTGKKYISEIRKFNPNIKVITAPCLRNRYYRVKQLHHEKFTILAAMSYYSEDTIMMINIINKYCCLASDVAVNVKMHPANAMRKIEDYYKDRVTFLPNYVTGKLLDCIAEADVVFTSRSASSMEIICGGIPLICLCMPGELLDTSIAKEVSKDAYDIIYDDKDFAKAIEKIKLRKHNNAQRDIININPQDYFIEPTCENVKAFLEA